MLSSSPIRNAVLGLVVATVALTACASDEAEPTPPPASEGENGDTQLPEAAALSATVGPAGGEIVGAPGSALAGVRLVVPAGALAADTEIVLRPLVDPVPLANTAERVGPQIAVEPAGLALAVPASLTVPFDAELRSQWEDVDGECKVWLRDGEGWKNVAQTASSPEGVTVPLSTFTVAAAGISVRPKVAVCRLDNSCPIANGTCLENNGFCFTQLRSPSASVFTPQNLTVHNGYAYYLHSPGTNTLTVARYNLLSTTGETTLFQSLAATPSTPLSTRGRIAVTPSEDVWAGVVGYGNVRFRAASAAGRFDTATTLQPAGVVIDEANRDVLSRLTRRGAPLSQCNVEAGGCGFHLHGQVGAALNEISFLSDNDLVFARSKPAGGSGDPFLFFGTETGTATFKATGSSSAKEDPCGNALTVNVDTTPSGFRYTACSNGHVIDNAGHDYALGITISSMAADDTFGVYVVDASRTEIIQLHPSLEGGATMRRLSLTAEPAGTLAHDRLLPRAIRFQKDPPSLVLMTRGTANNGIPDVYVVNNLLF